ncbi:MULTISPECIES: sensor histidine kinase [Streptomyces]|uniref:histidine kinase n=1 Tax=Streptomyces katrae TaxID=68223 RepID=A0A0F4IR42_9ACTN|nr:sensor histidine kinase [Streptomyces katrae]KJY24490.1 histidine kinase [Streptomyces katrae]
MGTRAERLEWTRGDGLVAVGAAATDLTGLSLSAVVDGTPFTVTGALGLVLAALTLLFRRHHPLPVLGAVLTLGLVVNVATPAAPHFGLTLTVALFTVGRRCRPAAVAAAGLATVPLAAVGLGGSLIPSGLNVLTNAVAAALVVGAAVAANRWQREVEANRQLLAERAVAEERRRIARELHDIVAHHITTMQLMAGGARVSLEHDPGAAREALVTLEASGRMALGEMRQLLDVLRAGEEAESAPPAPQPGTADLQRIVTESRLAGMDTEFTVHGTVRPLPPTVGLTVFRVVQEALTNARKHAGNANARVRLTYRPQEVSVEVCDDGPGDGPPRRTPARPRSGRAGYGLIGMRERVALHGGTLEAAPREDGGFRVAARLPVPAAAGAPDGAEREDHRR